MPQIEAIGPMPRIHVLTMVGRDVRPVTTRLGLRQRGFIAPGHVRARMPIPYGASPTPAVRLSPNTGSGVYIPEPWRSRRCRIRSAVRLDTASVLIGSESQRSGHAACFETAPIVERRSPQVRCVMVDVSLCATTLARPNQEPLSQHHRCAFAPGAFGDVHRSEHCVLDGLTRRR